MTGATGFVGLHLVRRLVEEGWTVVAPVRTSVLRSRADAVRLLGCETPVIEDHTESIATAVRHASPDVVFHLATLFIAEHETADVEPLVRSNILFGAQVLEGLNSLGGGIVISLGTHWQQFENRSYSPVSLYGATKQAFESVLQYYSEVGAVRSQYLLISDSYGPGDPRRKLLAVLREAERTGDTVDLSQGEQRIDLVHVADVVEAVLTAAERSLGNESLRSERWAVRSDRSLSIRELVDIFQRVRSARISVRWGARSYRPRETFVPWTAECVLPGWAPKISLEEGLRSIE